MLRIYRTRKLDSLKLLNTLQIINAIHGHRVDHLVSTVHLSDGLGALLSVLLSLLHGDYLAILQVHNGRHFTTIRSCLVKLFSKLEFELHSLEGGGCLDGPNSSLLRPLHHWGGDGGGLPQKEVYVEGLEKLLVLLGAGSLVLTLNASIATMKL